jgi:lipopolysaccharide biosynthesis glycosyltransferase
VHDEQDLQAIKHDLEGRGFRVRAEQEPALRNTPVRMLYATRYPPDRFRRLAGWVTAPARMVPLRVARRLRPAPIEVACAADRRSLPHAAAMLRSVLLASRERVHVHLIGGEEMTSDRAQPLAGMVRHLAGEFSLHSVPDARLDGVVDNSPLDRWYSILLPELLPDLDRIIFLDLDLIVLQSLGPLWRTRLSRHLVAAVSTVFPSPQAAKRRCAQLGIDPGDHFDPGMMLLDLRRLRREASAEKVLALARAHGPALPPEDSINAVLAARRRMSAPRWNCTGDVIRLPDARRVFGARAQAKAVRDPAIRHFGGHDESEPWKPSAACEARELYWSHRNHTPWASGRNLNHPWGEFFPSFRHSRRERYASRRPDPQRRRAVQTMVHNEAVFLPIWLRYYSRFFAPDDIYVLDHDSTDRSTSGGGFVRVPVIHGKFDNIWMDETVQGHQRELLDRYDLVLTADADEIVAPDPRRGTLGDYLERFDEEFVNCLGYEVLHLKDCEPPLDPDRGVLDQRGWWFQNDGYNKPALAMAPTPWEPGRHARADGRFHLDPDLRLIHLHRTDYDIALARHRRWRDRPWNERDLAEGWGTHNRVAEEEEFERWFYEDSAFESRGIRIELEPIPAHWRGVF